MMILQANNPKVSMAGEEGNVTGFIRYFIPLVMCFNTSVWSCLSRLCTTQISRHHLQHLKKKCFLLDPVNLNEPLFISLPCVKATVGSVSITDSFLSCAIITTKQIITKKMYIAHHSHRCTLFQLVTQCIRCYLCQTCKEWIHTTVVTGGTGSHDKAQ